jgi:hypothetical protein
MRIGNLHEEARVLDVPPSPCPRGVRTHDRSEPSPAGPGARERYLSPLIAGPFGQVGPARRVGAEPMRNGTLDNDAHAPGAESHLRVCLADNRGCPNLSLSGWRLDRSSVPRGKCP